MDVKRDVYPRSTVSGRNNFLAIINVPNIPATDEIAKPRKNATYKGKGEKLVIASTKRLMI